MNNFVAVLIFCVIGIVIEKTLLKKKSAKKIVITGCILFAIGTILAMTSLSEFKAIGKAMEFGIGNSVEDTVLKNANSAYNRATMDEGKIASLAFQILLGWAIAGIGAGFALASGLLRRQTMTIKENLNSKIDT